MGSAYLELCKRMKGNKAIVRIAKKLANRVRRTKGDILIANDLIMWEIFLCELQHPKGKVSCP